MLTFLRAIKMAGISAANVEALVHLMTSRTIVQVSLPFELLQKIRLDRAMSTDAAYPVAF